MIKYMTTANAPVHRTPIKMAFNLNASLILPLKLN